MILDGEDDGVVGLEERVVADRPHYVDELDFGGEGVAVEYQGTLGTVPAVELDRPGKRRHYIRGEISDIVASLMCKSLNFTLTRGQWP